MNILFSRTIVDNNEPKLKALIILDARAVEMEPERMKHAGFDNRPDWKGNDR